MFKASKRFVAGAVCPECQQMDKLVIYQEAERGHRECVHCGFREELLLTTASQEPVTRVNRPASAADERQPVRIVEPGQR